MRSASTSASATRWAATGALLAALLAGSGCSWVRDMTGWGEDEAKRPQPPGLQQPYPNLATVPNRTPQTGTTRERLQIEEGLLADRQNARHVTGPVAGPDRRFLSTICVRAPVFPFDSSAPVFVPVSIGTSLP